MNTREMQEAASPWAQEAVSPRVMSHIHELVKTVRPKKERVGAQEWAKEWEETQDEAEAEKGDTWGPDGAKDPDNEATCISDAARVSPVEMNQWGLEGWEITPASPFVPPLASPFVPPLAGWEKTPAALEDAFARFSINSATDQSDSLEPSKGCVTPTSLSPPLPDTVVPLLTWDTKPPSTSNCDPDGVCSVSVRASPCFEEHQWRDQSRWKQWGHREKAPHNLKDESAWEPHRVLDPNMTMDPANWDPEGSTVQLESPMKRYTLVSAVVSQEPGTSRKVSPGSARQKDRKVSLDSLGRLRYYPFFTPTPKIIARCRAKLREFHLYCPDFDNIFLWVLLVTHGAIPLDAVHGPLLLFIWDIDHRCYIKDESQFYIGPLTAYVSQGGYHDFAHYVHEDQLLACRDVLVHTLSRDPYVWMYLASTGGIEFSKRFLGHRVSRLALAHCASAYMTLRWAQKREKSFRIRASGPSRRSRLSLLSRLGPRLALRRPSLVSHRSFSHTRLHTLRQDFTLWRHATWNR